MKYEASIDVDINGERLRDVYDRAWGIVTAEVARRIAEHNEV